MIRRAGTGPPRPPIRSAGNTKWTLSAAADGSHGSYSTTSSLWFGKFGPAGWACAPYNATSAVCKQGANVSYVMCPQAVTAAPYAYSDPSGVDFYTDFTTHYKVTRLPSSTVTSAQVVAASDGRQMIQCHASQAGKLVNIERKP